MSRKKLKKAVRKVSSVGVRRVPSAFDDDAFEEVDSRKGVCFWPLFNFRKNCPSDSENEFVDVDSFSDAAPEVRRRLFLLLLMSPLSLLMLLPPLRSLLPKPLLLKPLPPTNPPPNLPRNLSSPFKGGRTLPNMLPWSKFGRLFPKIRLPLPLWPLSTKALVRLIAASYYVLVSRQPALGARRPSF
jgi:hypothetical protein